MAGVPPALDTGPDLKLMAPVPAKVFMAMQYLDWCRECQVHYNDNEIGPAVKKLELDNKEQAIKVKALDVLGLYFGGDSNFDDVTIPDCMPASKPDDDRTREPVPT